MMRRRVFVFALSVILAAAAHATPVVPPSQQPAGAERAEKPLVLIRFNQNGHTYFANALRRGVQAAETAKAGVFYEVVSYVPETVTNSRSKNQRVNRNAEANLQAVVGEIKRMGVPVSRIDVTSRSAAVNGQEIHVYVR